MKRHELEVEFETRTGFVGANTLATLLLMAGSAGGFPLAGYVTHLTWAARALLRPATAAELVLALVGLLPPIGIIHGWLLWLGWVS